MKKAHRNLKNGKDKLKRILKKSTENVKVKFKTVPKEIVAYAKKNPIKTMGFSVIAGIIISQLKRFHK